MSKTSYVQAGNQTCDARADLNIRNFLKEFLEICTIPLLSNSVPVETKTVAQQV